LDESDVELQNRLDTYAKSTAGLDARVKTALIRFAQGPPATTLNDDQLRKLICGEPEEVTLAGEIPHT
jgi:hypothetical protein